MVSVYVPACTVEWVNVNVWIWICGRCILYRTYRWHAIFWEPFELRVAFVPYLECYEYDISWGNSFLSKTKCEWMSEANNNIREKKGENRTHQLSNEVQFWTAQFSWLCQYSKSGCGLKERERERAVLCIIHHCGMCRMDICNYSHFRHFRFYFSSTLFEMKKKKTGKKQYRVAKSRTTRNAQK